MGITCKEIGKMKGIMKKVDNEILASKAAKKEKKSKKNKSENE